MLTKAHHLPLPWATLIQSTSHNPSSHFRNTHLILSFHWHLGLPNGLFPSCFLTKTLYAFLLSPIHAACPTRLIFLDFVPQTIQHITTNGIHTCYSHWNLQSQCGQEICIWASVIFLAQRDAATSALQSLYRPYRSHHLNTQCSEEPTLCSVLWVVSVTAWVVTGKVQFTRAAWNGKVKYKSIMTIQYGDWTLVEV